MTDHPRSGLRTLPGRLLENPLLRRVARNSGYLFSAGSAAALLSMGQSALAARLLGVAGFGVLGVVTQFATVINGLTSFRMSQLVVAYVSRFHAQGDDRRAAAVFKAAGLAEMLSSLLAYALLALLSPLAARLFAPHDPALVGLYRLYGLIIVANLMVESSTGLLQVFNRFRTIATITVAQSAATLALIAVVFGMGGGLGEVLLAYLAGKTVWALCTIGAALAQAGRHWGVGWWRTPLGLLKDHRKELASFALNTNLTTTLNLFTRDSELLWLSLFGSEEQVGFYKVALAIRNLLINPVEPLISTTYREMAREIAERRWRNVRYLLRSGSLLAAAWTIPASLGLVVVGRWAIGLIWGPSFAPAYGTLLLLLAGVAAVNIFFWNRNVLLPLGKPGYPTRVHLVAAVVKIAGIFVLVPGWGATGVAVLLCGFYLGTVGALVWKSAVELRRAEAALPAVSGA